MGIVSIVFLAILAAAVVWSIYTYNGFIHRQLEVDNGWSSIDIQLKRRRDLIPNLVETAKGYMKHEQSTLERIAELRASIMKAPTGASVMDLENKLSGALGSLLAVVENYPDLKANTNFLSLQEELASTENRISFARQYYNEAVKSFNISIQLFPASVIASFVGLRPREMWNLDENAAEREVVSVKF